MSCVLLIFGLDGTHRVYLPRCWVVGVGRKDMETLASGRCWDAASRKAGERRRERLTSVVVVVAPIYKEA
jgi:hypothetical protein